MPPWWTCSVAFLATPDAFKIECDRQGGLSIGRGRIYVDGLVAENHGSGRLAWDAALDEQYGAEPVSYTQQPYLPAAPEVSRSGGPYLVYLDVWQREITMIEDPDLGDPALGGANTTTRLQTVWQVKLREASSANVERLLAEDCKFRPAAARLSTAPVVTRVPRTSSIASKSMIRAGRRPRHSGGRATMARSSPA